MLTSDFRGDFGPEKFSVKHLKKLVDRELKAEGWSKYLRGVSEEDYEQRIQKYQRFVHTRNLTPRPPTQFEKSNFCPKIQF